MLDYCIKINARHRKRLEYGQPFKVGGVFDGSPIDGTELGERVGVGALKVEIVEGALKCANVPVKMPCTNAWLRPPW